MSLKLSSCDTCGIVVDLKKVSFIEKYPDECEDDLGEMSDDVIWIDKEPCDTWKCPNCSTLNGEENDY